MALNVKIKKGHVFCVVLLMVWAPGVLLAGDSLRQKNCICELYQAQAEKEYKKILAQNDSKKETAVVTKKKYFRIFPRKKNTSQNTRKKKLKNDRISACWKPM